MKRIAVVSITVLATLAVIASAAALMFRVRPAGEDGYMLLYGRQAEECDTGGGCAVFSEREFKAAVYAFLLKLKEQKPGLSS